MPVHEGRDAVQITLQQYYEILLRYLRPQWGRFILLAVLVFASVGLQVINPLFMRDFLNAAKTGAAMPVLYVSAIAFIAVALAQQIDLKFF